MLCYCISIYFYFYVRFSGGNIDAIPHPAVDWKDFIAAIKQFNKSTPLVFDPISNAMKPWIDVGKLNSFYKIERLNGGGGGSSSCILM